MMPVSAVTVPAVSSISTIRFIFFMSRTMPPWIGSAPPWEPEPPPQTVTGMRCWLAMRRIFETCAVDSGYTT